MRVIVNGGEQEYDCDNVFVSERSLFINYAPGPETHVPPKSTMIDAPRMVLVLPNYE